MFPASSSSRPRQAYVRALSRKGPGDHQMEFYSVPINDENVSGGEGGTVRVLTPIKAAKVPLYGGFAAVDNKLYCIGGDPPSKYLYNPRSVYRPVRLLYTFDTSCRLPMKSPWKKRPSMRIGRFFPRTVVVDGKIFVFEGIDGPDPNATPWAEVFDTKSGSWSSLSPPSQLPKAYGLFAVALPDHGKILVGSHVDDFFYFYYVGAGRWERWDHKLVLDIPCNVKPAVLDTTLFWFCNCKLQAYNLTHKWSYSVCIKDLENVVPRESVRPPNVDLFYPTVHHVAGNVFSLLCLEYFSGVHQATLLHCVKFSISDLVFQGGEDVCFSAAVTSAEAYAIQTPTDILDALVMEDGGSNDA